VFIVNSVNGSGVNFEDNFATDNWPIQICNPTSIHQTTQQWFNPACFTQALVGQLGTASRTPLSGPGFVNTDFSLIKRFRVTERVGADFRAEFFNLFNHAQFGLPNADLASGTAWNQTTTQCYSWNDHIYGKQPALDSVRSQAQFLRAHR
jgi:hypothetical protein